MSTTTNADSDALSLSERRRRASRALMRTDILDAAQHIIRTQGLDALSLRALAKSVGVTAPALYEYFPSKDAILRALFVQGSQVMLGRMDQVEAEHPPGMQRLVAILDGYRAFARDEPAYFRLMFGTVDPNLALSEDEYSGMQGIFDRFVGVIEECIEVGDIRTLPALTMGGALWSLIHGAALLETESFMARKDPDCEDPQPFFDSAIDLVLLGFATEAGAALIGPIAEIW